jgi:NADH dehydrogenase [ubiquinone] 1 alpha subcomplex assembly factor 7
MDPFETRLKDIIITDGPVDIGTFMMLAIGHYYATRDPFGVKGDFTTAPEISQMFGEMIGAFLADTWMKIGSPSPVLLVEGGPGRGTLMADILRATKNVPGFHAAAQIHLIETSPVLSARQAETLNAYKVEWHTSFDALPPNIPMLFVANELLDALPMSQYQYQNGAWHERVVGLQGDKLSFGLIPASVQFPPQPEGSIYEVAPVRDEFARQLSKSIAESTGVALLIDYGHDHHGPGDTLQAVRAHQYVDVLDGAGEADLTSHVDFESVARVAREQAVVHGPVGQGDFLLSLGIALRAARLNQETELHRLTAADQMGTLFRVIAITQDPALSLAGFDKE